MYKSQGRQATGGLVLWRLPYRVFEALGRDHNRFHYSIHELGRLKEAPTAWACPSIPFAPNGFCSVE
jgi:hypothetical protein